MDIWADLDNSGDLATRHVRGDIVDQLFARVAGNGDTLWNLTDHFGSLRDVIDNSGAVLDSLVYDGFGRISESDPEYGGRYKWTSREFDVETGLQFNRARYYDADTGRWISQDPLGFDAGDSNLYRYVANRPTGASDPSGKVLFTPLDILALSWDKAKAEAEWPTSLGDFPAVPYFEWAMKGVSVNPASIQKKSFLFLFKTVSFQLTMDAAKFRMGCMGLQWLRLGPLDAYHHKDYFTDVK